MMKNSIKFDLKLATVTGICLLFSGCMNAMPNRFSSLSNRQQVSSPVARIATGDLPKNSLPSGSPSQVASTPTDGSRLMPPLPTTEAQIPIYGE